VFCIVFIGLDDVEVFVGSCFVQLDVSMSIISSKAVPLGSHVNKHDGWGQ
jgi:hypothetical protein